MDTLARFSNNDQLSAQDFVDATCRLRNIIPFGPYSVDEVGEIAHAKQATQEFQSLNTLDEIHQVLEVKCARCGGAEPTECEERDEEHDWYRLTSDMQECVNSDKGCRCVVHTKCAIEDGLCPHCAFLEGSRNLNKALDERQERDEALVDATGSLRFQVGVLKDEIAKETDPSRLQAMLEDAKDLAVEAAIIPAAVYARLTTLCSEPLPLVAA